MRASGPEEALFSQDIRTGFISRRANSRGRVWFDTNVFASNATRHMNVLSSNATLKKTQLAPGSKARRESAPERELNI